MAKPKVGDLVSLKYATSIRMMIVEICAVYPLSKDPRLFPYRCRGIIGDTIQEGWFGENELVIVGGGK